MSDKINDGRAAFPVPNDANVNDQEGMSLRDYLAAKAMQGILGGDHPITHDENPLPTIARVAYEIADAMLKARQS